MIYVQGGRLHSYTHGTPGRILLRAVWKRSQAALVHRRGITGKTALSRAQTSTASRGALAAELRQVVVSEQSTMHRQNGIEVSC